MLSKKTVGLVVLLAGVCLAFAACGADPNAKTGSISLNDIAGESAMTQKDMDIYIKIWPEIAPVISDGKAAAKIYKKDGISRVRLAYIRLKSDSCNFVNNGLPVNFDAYPASFRPTELELELVRKNWSAIWDVEQRYKKN